MDVSVLTPMLGATITKIDGATGADEMLFHATDGRSFRFVHHQDCCETVRVEDVCGDLDDLIGSPLVEAEEVSSEGAPEPEDPDSYTWTFYKFGTSKGSVTVRWLGQSNGYYSEGVEFEVVGSQRQGNEP